MTSSGKNGLNIRDGLRAPNLPTNRKSCVIKKTHSKKQVALIKNAAVARKTILQLGNLQFFLKRFKFLNGLFNSWSMQTEMGHFPNEWNIRS